MKGYGLTAKRASELLRTPITDNPVEAWKIAVGEIFPHSSSSQSKGCPRGAFLGLCEEGFVEGARSGQRYTRSELNKAYAIRAARLLQQDISWVEKRTNLWQLVSGNSGKTENGQIDVVIGLHESGLLKIGSNYQT